MNHFEEILCEGESLHHHNFNDNEELYDKSTNQSNLLTAGQEHMNSPFDSSPKASMFFFSLNSPRQNSDNFQFNNQFNHPLKLAKDHIEPIARRLQFQEDASLYCQQEDIQEEGKSIKEEDIENNESSDTPRKTKKIKKSKNSKGLKNLSVGVYQIVVERVHTTYKQVAKDLIDKISKNAKDGNGDLFGYEFNKKAGKDQHNIKRRVYDALNVLISADLLRKQGKRIICNDLVKESNGNHDHLLKQLEKLKISNSQKKLIINDKLNRLQSLKKKQGKIQDLINKNKKLGNNYPKRVMLPFIVARSKIQDIRCISIGSQDVQIQYQGNVLIMGDIDTIQQLQEPAYLVSK